MNHVLIMHRSVTFYTIFKQKIKENIVDMLNIMSLIGM